MSNTTNYSKNTPSSVYTHQTICKTTLDPYCQIVTIEALNNILQKAANTHFHNKWVKQVISEQNIKKSQQFAVDNCNSILHNYFIKNQSQPRQIKEEINLISPSKSPNSFLQFEQFNKEFKDETEINEKGQSRKVFRKINNKIYRIKNSEYKQGTKQKKSLIQNTKNEPFKAIISNRGWLSCRPQFKKLSFNSPSQNIQFTSRDVTNKFSSIAQNSMKKQSLMDQISQKMRSQYIQQKGVKKSQQNYSKLIKLEYPKQPMTEKTEKIQKQTNNYITYLREKKEKLQSIMKGIDQNDSIKKNYQYQKGNLSLDKKQNLNDNFTNMISHTTDYEGNIIFVNQHKISPNSQIKPQSLKKIYSKIPKYQSYPQSPIPHNIPFKIKDIDDKTKIFLHQIFSSARVNPLKSQKKLVFNQLNTVFSKNESSKKPQTVKVDAASTISINYAEKRINQQKKISYMPSIKNILNPADTKTKQSKERLRSAKKIIEKLSVKGNGQNSSNFFNSFFVNLAETKSQKISQIIKSESSDKQNKVGQLLFKQPSKHNKQNNFHRKQRIHPSQLKEKKNMALKSEQKKIE